MSKVSYQRSKGAEMSTQLEARQLLWAAVPPAIHDNRKSWLARAARLLGWSERRTKALFYCEARVVTADEWRTLNQRLDALKIAERRHGEETHALKMVLRDARQARAVAGGKVLGLGASPSRVRE